MRVSVGLRKRCPKEYRLKEDCASKSARIMRYSWMEAKGCVRNTASKLSPYISKRMIIQSREDGIWTVRVSGRIALVLCSCSC
jgi:hypothetical protein